MSDQVTFEPAGTGFHGRIAGTLTVEKIRDLQARAQAHFGDTPARWAVVDMDDAVPLRGTDDDEQAEQMDNVQRVTRNLMVIRRDEFRLAIVADSTAFDEIVALMVVATEQVGSQLPGRRLEVERFDDATEALAWARSGGD